ncbi:MAG TPA: glycine zipper 2TM domain-containing protein [Caulobacteraceae bacterium]|jgi:outer membrane lipoprotein SlyB
MKFAPAAAAMAAIVAAGSLATPSLAQDYGYGSPNDYRNPCQAAQHDSGTSGGVLGALAGAVIGSNLAAHSGGRPGGAILGALAGAAIGNNIGRSSAKSSGACDGADYGRYEPVYYSAPYQPYGYGRHYDRGAYYRGYHGHDAGDRGYGYRSY